MRRLGYAIHLLVMSPKGQVDEMALAELRSLVGRVDFVERSPMRRSLATSAPTLVSRNSSLADVSLSDEYDMTLAESEHVMPIFDNPRLRTRLRVLRVHNHESKYMWELARSDERPGWKVFFALEALRYRRFARTAYRKLDAVWFISRHEYERFNLDQLAPRASAAWLPPAVTLEGRPERTGPGSRRVLFLGGLKNPLNRDGVRWYLKEVHPLLTEDRNYELVIAGNAEGSHAAHLLAREACRMGRCAVHLNLGNLGPLYDGCAVIINPMRRGSGVKMKTIHAIQHRIPLVTTSVGAEGSGFADKEHIRVADEPNAFADAIRDILDSPARGDAMADRAYQYLTAHYDSDKNIKRLLSSLLAPPITAERAVDEVPGLATIRL
jgi:glycosyltransferase involved in cell wall biosynthesis